MQVICAPSGARPGFSPFKKPFGVSVVGPADPTVRCPQVEEAAHDTRRSESSSLLSSSPRHRLWRRRTLHPCPNPRYIPKIKTNHVKYPEGWELIEPTL
ncbi:hypothetical protein C4D60_Mb01t08860 [Musa balbisiana]|uniref:Uncharacterized protein n=1 Tax=Musa balbisiana TaxID=52838 RepID=A0A4S8JL44_MUSBA|nr:hypothetical protein C4D60_Mb01t08860 [Musa balbisiana]